jgi:hypothetical protein
MVCVKTIMYNGLIKKHEILAFTSYLYETYIIIVLEGLLASKHNSKKDKDSDHQK